MMIGDIGGGSVTSQPLMPALDFVSAFILAFVAASVSWTLVRITRHVAGTRGWVAPVRGDRWHAHATAQFGGVGIALAFVLCLAIARGFLDGFRDATSANAALAIALIVGAVGAAIIGLCDDIAHFRPSGKLAAQFGCACAFLWICGGIDITGRAPIDSLICVLWIVGVMNAVNMLDNMDGVAACAVTIGLIAITAVSATVAPGSFVGVIAVIAAGATAGFLAQNLPRAKIFMGDCGSLFLGFLLAALVLVCARTVNASGQDGVLESSQGWMPTLVAGVGCCMVPLVDMTVVSVARIRRGQSPMLGGRDHSTHRLAQLEFSGASIVMCVGIVAILGGALALMSVDGTISLTVGIICLGGGFAVLVGVLLSMAFSRDAHDASARSSASDAPHRLAAFMPFGRVVIDLALIAVTMNLGYLIRWDFSIPPELANSLAWSLPIAVASCVSVNAFTGVYWKDWRATRWIGLRGAVLSALLGATIAVILIAALWSPDRLFSRVAVGIFFCGYPLATGVVRFAAAASRRGLIRSG